MTMKVKGRIATMLVASDSATILSCLLEGNFNNGKFGYGKLYRQVILPTYEAQHLDK